MTLHDLKGIIDYSFDIEDDEISASIYIELDEIREDFIRNIEVVNISRDRITCKLTNFLRREACFHPTRIREYLNDNYYDGEQKDYLISQLTKRPKYDNRTADITDDGGEAVYHFIENDLYDFLTQGEAR